MSSTYTNNNVVYTYTQGDSGSAYVSVSPNAIGAITILKEFTVDDTTYQVKSIAESAFEGNILTSLTFQANSQITSIGNRSFYNSGLEIVDIPLSVITIGEGAFELNKISSFTGGINLETIGTRAFASNKLTSLTIPNKVKTVSANAFSSNSLITVMFLGSDVETIGTSAFQGNSLTKLFIPKSVSSLGASAFRNNKLIDVYFFNVLSIGTNCFTGNDILMNAYYLTGISNEFITTPSPFTSKTPKTVVEMLTPLLDEVGVSVETLVNDDYTFDQLAEAQATAEQLFGYFDNISSPVPLSSYIPYFSVSTLKTAKSSLTITNFKTAAAPIQQVFDQYGLSAMIVTGYTVLQIVTGVTPLQTISQFKTALAPIQQVFDQYGLSAMIGAGYTVSQIVQDVTPLQTITNFKTALASIQEVFDQYGLSAMIGVGYTVLQVIDDVTPLQTISQFKQVSAPIQQVFDQYGLSAMIGAGYTVSQIVQGATPLQTISQFKTALAPIQEVFDQYGLSAMIGAGYTVSQIVTGVTPIQTITNFKQASAPIWDMLNAFSFSNLVPFYTTEELVYNSQDSRVTVTGNQNLTLAKMKEAGDELWQVMNYYSNLADLLQVDYSVSELVIASNLVDSNGVRLVNVTALQDLGTKLASFVTANATVIGRGQSSKLLSLINYFTLSDLLGSYSVAELKAAKSTLTAGDFKTALAPIQQVFDQYGLSPMIGAGYTVSQIVTDVTPLQTIDDFKTASASIQQVFDQYGLSAMIGAGYTVSQIVQGATPLHTIDDFKTAFAPIQQVFDQYGLSAMIGAGYTVSQIVTDVTPLQTIAQFKTALAPIQEVSSQYGLSAMIGAGYTVSQIVQDVTPLQTIDDFKTASASIQEVFDQYGLSAMIGAGYTVSQIVQGASPLQTITNFKEALAPIWEMLNAFSLANLVPFYTTEELVYNSQDSRVTVTGNQNLTLEKMKEASDELWQVMNYYSDLADLLQVNYSVSELVIASNLVDSNGVRLVTVTALQDLGTKLASFVTANATVIGREQPSKLLSLINYFTLSDLIGSYSVADLKTAKSTLTAGDFKTALAPIQQVFDQYGLSEMIVAGYTVLQIVTDVTPIQTIAQFKTALAPIQEVFDQYGLSAMVGAGYTVLQIVQDVTPLHTIGDFKTASASIQQVFDQYGLSAMIVAGYTVSQIVTGVTPIQTIGDFKTVSAPIQQVFDQYGLSPMIGAGYTVQEVIAGVTPIQTIAQFKTALAPIQEVFDQYGLSEMIGAGYTVSQIVTGVTPIKTIGDFKTASASIQQVFDQYGLSAMIVAGYTVLQIVTGVTPIPTIGNFKTALAPIQQVFDQYGLSPMIGAGYTVSQIVTDVTASPALTITDFKTASASIQEVFDQYGLSAMIGAGYTVSQIVQDVTPLHTIDDFKTAFAPIQQVFNQYGLSAMIGAGYTVSQIVTGVTPLQTITDFKEALAPIQQVFDQYGLSAMIGAGYTVSQIVQDVTPVQTIGDFKTASASIQQVFDQYVLSAMIGAGYTVSQIVQGASPLQTITDFKEALAPIQQVFDQYGLSAMIGAGYTVSQIVQAVTPVQTIGDFKDASAPIQQVFDQYELSAMIGEGYIVSDIVAVVTTLGYSDFVGAEAEAWNLMTHFDYNLLLPNFSVSQIKAASSDSRVKASNSSLTAQNFKTHTAAIWQMLNAFPLSELTPLYTSRQLVDASNQKDGSDNFLVTVLEYQDLTASDMKEADDELWQIMNVYPLADLLQLDYSVAELVAASNQVDGDGNRLVTVTELQDLGTKLSSFVTSNATVITRTTVSRLWNLVNYFELSDLAVHYNVAQLKATSTDTRVSTNKTVTVAKLHAIPMPIQDMLTEFGLQALWDDNYTIAELKPLGVTVADFWSLSSDAENHRVKPTVQQLSVAEYSLQNLWTGIGEVATIYDGLTVKPTVAQLWALTSGKPTVQELSVRYGLQQLWDDIVTSTRSDDVSTIRVGLTTTPTVSQFKELSSPPTVKQLFDGGYTLAALVAGLYTVNQIRNTTTGIGNTNATASPPRQQSPTLAEFKDAGALLWQLLNCSLYRNMPGAVGLSGFPLGHFIKVGYKVSEIVEASKLKDAFNNYLVDEDSNLQNLTPLKFNPDGMQYLSDTNQITYFTASEKMDILCDVLSYFEPGQIINNADDGLYDYYFRVPKMIEASKLKDELGNYKVTKVDNQDLDTKFSRFITGTNITKVSSGLTSRLLRYKSLFTSFSIITFEADYDVGEVLGANASWNSGADNAWDAQNDWRVSLSELKSVPIPTSRMVEYYMTRSQGLQTLWDLQYSVSELRLASNEVFTNIYSNPDRISVQKLLALSSDTVLHRSRPTVRLLQQGGYTLELLSLGMSGGSLSPLIADETGMSPPPTVADFYNQISDEFNRRPTIQQLYNTYGLQNLFNDLSVFDQSSNLNSEGMNLIKTSLTPQTTVAEWWALSPKPTVQQLSSNGKYGLQALWNGIGDVETIYNGLDVKPTVAQWWALSPKPTVAQLFVVYNLQDLWDGISSVSAIKSGISPTVTQWWALSPKPSMNQLSESGYSLQELWDYFASVETVYDALTSKPSVSEWWTLSINTLIHVLKPTVAQLSVRYSLQLIWNGIGNVSTIKAGLQTTVAQFWALSPKPTIQQLYVGGFEVAELIAGNTGIKLSDILSSVSQNGNTSANTIIADLKAVGFKINIPAPRIKTATYTSGSVILTLVQGSPDIPITQYLVSYTSDGGQTWSEYAVVRDSTSTAVPKAPLLPNVSNILIISGFTATRKLHSFRLKAEGSEIQSNTSNTFKNVFF